MNSDYSLDDAMEIQRIVDKVVSAIETDSALDRRTQSWIDNISESLSERFERVGLLEPSTSLTVRQLFDMRYSALDARGIKDATKKRYEYDERLFFEFFKNDTRADEVTREHAFKFVEHLKESLADATISMTISRLSTVFEYAVEIEQIRLNPFKSLRLGMTAKNKDREFYITMQMLDSMLSKCRNAEERLLLTLYRVGGLRAHEALILTWNCVNFNDDSMRVYCSKTNKERTIPLFKRVRSALLDVERIDNFVVHFTSSQARHAIERIRHDAGIEEYPRLIQNMRSSASIDIHKRFGSVCESEWLGHTAVVANEHYLHSTRDDFTTACLCDF